MVYVKASQRRREMVSAARAVMSRDGIAHATLRSIAREGQVSLGTLHYVFTTKEQLITAVLQDVTDEVSAIFRAVDTSAGLEFALRLAAERYWEQLVVNDPTLALMRHELFIHALRTPELRHLARWQVESYDRIVAEWCQEAVSVSGEVCDAPIDVLARVLVGNVIGVVVHYLSDRDLTRSRRDLDAHIDMLVRLAAPHPARRT
jgi:AcrR family transcriptional regulator